MITQDWKTLIINNLKEKKRKEVRNRDGKDRTKARIEKKKKYYTFKCKAEKT